jgi:SAM-dependent methyltransferase
MTFANTEQAEFWAELAPTWIGIEDQLEQFSAEPGRLAMDRLGLQPGQAVVDLGCGTGRTTLELASRVAPGGRAVGVDIAAEMLDRARQHAAEAKVDNVEFRQADVQAEDLGDGQFDAAYSRFGVMFYTDPVAAFAGVDRALRSGGSLSFVCWQPITANDWMFVPGMAAVSVTGKMPPMAEPDQPGPFSLSDPERVRSILGAAGFTDVEVEVLNDFVERPEDQIPQAAAISMKIGAVRELLKDTDPSMADRVQAAIEDAFRSRVQDGVARVSRGTLLVRAKANHL